MWSISHFSMDDRRKGAPCEAAVNARARMVVRPETAADSLSGVTKDTAGRRNGGLICCDMGWVEQTLSGSTVRPVHLGPADRKLLRARFARPCQTRGASKDADREGGASVGSSVVLGGTSNC
jgi:hypothetical protein